jgi:hypothetical protein
LAKNSDEFGGLWNSIMEWFQGYESKKYFQNMDWQKSMNTRTHTHWFKKRSDVKNYKIKHPWVKSFVLYFWTNTDNNAETLEDLKKRSNWLKKEWIQPVLSTCIWSDNHARLLDLNKKIVNLHTELNCPLLDFASSYDKNLIVMANKDHPNAEWYKTMEELILTA